MRYEREQEPLNSRVVLMYRIKLQTRIAAAQAVEAILQNVPQWKPQPSTVKCEYESYCTYESVRLTFKQFDLKSVLEKGAHLIGSEGTEFDCHDDVSVGEDSNGSNDRDRLIRQRMLLNEKLGLNQSSQLGILNINDLVTLDDIRNTTKRTDTNKTLMPVQEVLNLEMNSSCENAPGNASSTTPAPPTGAALSLSCREMNRARRKARQYQSQTSTSNSGNNSTTNQATSTSATFSRSSSTSDEPDTKKSKVFEAEFASASNGKKCYIFVLLKKCARMRRL